MKLDNGKYLPRKKSKSGLNLTVITSGKKPVELSQAVTIDVSIIVSDIIYYKSYWPEVIKVI